MAACFLTMLALPLLAAPAEAASVEPAGYLPSKRLGSSAVHVGDGIHYIFGGRVTKTHFLAEIVRFDENTRDYEVLDTKIPTPLGAQPGRYQMAAAYDGSKIYLFGGAALYELEIPDSDGNTQKALVPQSLESILEFDPATHTIREVGQMKQGRWGATAQFLGGSIYVMGGLTFEMKPSVKVERHDTIVKFNPRTHEARQLDNKLPFPVQDAASAVAYDRIWLFGGIGENNTNHPCPWINSNGATYRRTLCASVKITWFDAGGEFPEYARVELPQGLKFASAAAVGEDVFVMGGTTESGHGSSKIYKFNARKQAIETLFPTLPGGRWGMPATVSGEDILLFGGRDGEQHADGMEDITRFRAGPTPPWAPQSLSANSPPLTGDERPVVHLEWDPPRYDGGAAIQAYRVIRIGESGAARIVGEVAGDLKFSDPDVKAGATYTYRVVAVNARGESPTGVETEVVVGKRAPSVPRAFQAFAGDAKVELRWAPPEDDGGDGIKNYRIYRSDQSQPRLLEAGSITPEGGFYTWTDHMVANNETYTYRIAADNSLGEGPRTDEVVVTPLPVPDAPVDLTVTEEGETVRVTWRVASGAASGFHVYKGTEPYNLERVTVDGPVTETTFTDTEVRRGLTYYYAVSAVNNLGEGPWSGVSDVALFDPPGKPLNLLAKPKPGAIELQWTPPQETGGADADTLTYVVLRDNRPIANDVQGVMFVDRKVQPGREYTYAVQAYNGLLSETSTPKSATPLDYLRIPPVAAVTAVGNTHVELGEEIALDASLSTDEDGRVVKWIFDFGDGSGEIESDSPTATHAYDQEASFVVNVWAVDDQGLKSERPAQVTVDVGRGGSETYALQKDKEAKMNDTDLSPDVDTQDKQPGSDSRFPLPAPGVAVLAVLGALAAAVLPRRRD